MPNLAEKTRLAVESEHPGAVVVERPRNGIGFDLGNGHKRAVFGVGEGFHLPDETEIDTAWTAVNVDGFQWGMTTAGYHAHARNILNAGDLIRFTHPASGHNVTFDPQSINWINQSLSRQQIAIKQAVSATAGTGDEDDRLHWANGWGAGRHFTYICGPQQLRKLITIDSAANLPAPTVTGTVHFEAEFALKHSAGLTVWLDGVQWAKTNGVRVKTSNQIEFKDAGGNVIFYLARPFAIDANGSEAAAEYEVRRQGAATNLFCTVRIPKPWIDSAVFPIQIDPTFSTDVAASSDDALEDDGVVTLNGTTITINEINDWVGMRFLNVTVPNGATVSNATVTLNVSSTASDDPDEDIYCEDVDDAATFTTGASNISSRSRTTAFTNWTATGIGTGSKTSPSFATAAEEVFARGGWASGNDFVVLFDHKSTAAFRFTAYDNGSLYPSISIDYTAGYDPLAAAGGSFALTGQAAALSVGRKLTADAGSFALSGQDAGLRAARKLTADAGSFTLSGQDASLEMGRALAAAAGSFVLSGQDATLIPPGVSLTAEAGSFALTGQDAGLRAARKLTAEAGSFALAGQDASLEVGRAVAAAAGSFALTGQDAGLRADRKLTADAGSFTLTGQDAGLIPPGGRLEAGAGSFALTGQDAGLRTARKLTADAGSFALAGQDASLEVGRTVAAAAGSFSLTGQDAGLRADRKLTAAAGSFAVTGQDAGLIPPGASLTAEAGSFTLSGQDAGLRTGRLLTAVAGSFALTGQDAGLRAARRLTAEAGAFTLAGQDAGLRVGRTVIAAAGSFTLTGQAAGLRADRKLIAGTMLLVVTGGDLGVDFSGATPSADRLYLVEAELRSWLVEAEIRTLFAIVESRSYEVVE